MPEKPKGRFLLVRFLRRLPRKPVVDLAEDILGVVNAWTSSSGPCHGLQEKGYRGPAPTSPSRVSFINARGPHHRQQEEWVHLLRKKSQFVISFGACANTGGIPRLRNQFTRAAGPQVLL